MGIVKKFKKVLVANRGEIAVRVFRALTELGIRTVAIYSEEDLKAQHRYKADEAYLVGEGKGPIEAYLDGEGIIELALRNGVDAIHPGYGFLAENAEFARRCQEAGIVFIGPSPEHLEAFGDKVKARALAIEAGLPVIPGTPEPIAHLEDVYLFAREYGYPFMIKAAAGGGGRGMRVVRKREEIEESFNRCRSEAKSAFGNSTVFLEKYIERPRHIEVQILADAHGQVVHLYERDCSVQRRHQKVVEVAPSVALNEEFRLEICQSALKLANKAKYINAGTVEFLVTQDGEYYFLEVNPRIQVEHTITEMITGIDLVQAQIHVAEGYRLSDPEIGISSQDVILCRGYAIQCRVTTEDPTNNFMPDTGKIRVYRSPHGFGVRLDGGTVTVGARISPHYDSLLAKVSVHALTFAGACRKMDRALVEFRIRGVKTNILFLENVVRHEQFIQGEVDTTFIDSHPELFKFPRRRDRGSKLLSFIGQATVNGGPGMKGRMEKPVFRKPRMPGVSLEQDYPRGTKQLLDELGPKGLADWVLSQKKLLITDTTMRDAHQSHIATRMRTHDIVKIAEATGKLAPDLFSLENWGGATFDVAYRFLKEDAWVRLETLRELVPNVLFQMLLRGANAVGYTNYPDNVIKHFVREAAINGMDVFRVFDSLNWVDGMRVAMDAVLEETDRICEACVCYTGDILDPYRSKYNLKYYVDMAKELEKAGAHIIALKDMAGLLKPMAAKVLIKALKEEVSIPIHLHTHDTSGNGVAMLLMAAEAGVDIVDCALSSMSGLTSQPSLNALAAALQCHERNTHLNLDNLQKLANYWEDVREYYQAFESGLKAGTADVYVHEMPGGQYTNLRQQAEAVGLGDRWEEVKSAYASVNNMLGDLIKVTPSSKMVGDFALFMVTNNLSEADVMERGDTLDFPKSVVDFFLGYIGQPYGGFPEKLQKMVLKGKDPFTHRPGELLEPVDFDALDQKLRTLMTREPLHRDVLSYALYPQVFEEYITHAKEFGYVSDIDTPTFFYGMRLGETVSVDIEKGKTLVVKLKNIGELQEDGTRIVYFELNGHPREVTVVDKSVESKVQKRPKAKVGDPHQIGASMPGTVFKVLVKVGDAVKKGDPLMVTEAMKMETTLQAPVDAVVKEILAAEGDGLEAGDLLIVLG